MYCPKCRTEVKEGVKFCPECGATIYQTASSAQNQPQAEAYTQSSVHTAQAAPKKASKNTEKKTSLLQKPWFIVILVLVILAAVRSGKNKSSSQTSSNDRIAAPVTTEAKLDTHAPARASTSAKATEAAKPSETASTEKVQDSESSVPVDTTLDASTIRPDVKEAIDSYEAFIDSYCEFLENYDKNDATMVSEYLSFVQKELEMTEKFEAMDESAFTEAEDKYYTEVNLRCTQKMLECAAKLN